MHNHHNPLIIFSGPSGVGKSTIVSRLKETGKYQFSVSATSRPRRSGEVDGVHYYFKSEEEMENTQLKHFLEFNEVHGHYYGTYRTELEKLKNSPLLMDVDVRGFEMIKTRCKDIPIFSIFIMPPSMDVLQQRLCIRADTPKDQIVRRLKHAHWEMAQACKYDRVIVNDDLDAAVGIIQDILDRLMEQEG